jgi:hypothetical protein
VKRGRPVLLLGLAAALASCLTPGARPGSSANAPAVSPASVTGGAPTPAELWAGDRGCIAFAPPGGGDKMGTGAVDLIIRTVQRSDPSYQLMEMHLALDGQPAFDSTEGAGLQDAQQFVRVPRVVPGLHTLTIRYLLAGKGTGAYGNMRGYKFKVKSERTFTPAIGQTTCMSVMLYFDPDRDRNPGERPTVDIREERAPLLRR